jgi:AraC-like DNA-binding protein
MNEHIKRYCDNRTVDYYNIIKVKETIENAVVAFRSNGYIIGITRMKDDLVVTSKGTSNLINFYKDMGIESAAQEEITQFFDNDRKTYPDSHIIQSRIQNGASGYDKIITVYKKVRLPDRGNTKMLVLFSFYDKSFLPDYGIGKNETAAIIQGERIISFKTNQEDGGQSAVLDTAMLEELNKLGNGKADSTSIVFSGYHIHMVNSGVLPWRYVYLAPVEGTRRQLAGILSETLMVSILLCLVGIGAAFFLVRKLYQPILNIINLFKPYGGNPGQDEWAYIRENMSRMNSSNENLRNIIQNNRLPLEVKFIKDLLYGLVPDDAIDGQISRYDLDWLRGASICIVLEFTNYKELDDNFSKEAVFDIKSEILTLLREKLKKSLVCKVIELDYRRYAVIAKESDMTAVKKVFSNVLPDIEISSELSLVAAVGICCESAHEIDKSFNNALYVLENRFVLDKKPVISAEDVDMDLHNRNYFYPAELERSLMNSVLKGKCEDVASILGNILDKNLKENSLKREVVFQFLFVMAETVNKILKQLNLDMCAVFGEDVKLYNELKKYDDKLRMKERLLEVFEVLTKRVQLENEKLDTGFADQLIRFVNDNYSRDISLAEIAERYNLTPGYISTLFKKVTRQNFKDYLNQLRVEKAKAILDKKDVKVKELAEMVGCNNVNTFIRIFNRYAGTSPGEYAKARLGEACMK